MVGAVTGGPRVHAHAADGVFLLTRRRRFVAVMVMRSVRGVCHVGDVEGGAPTIKRAAGSGSTGAWSAVKSEVEALAGRVVQAAYTVEFDRHDPGSLEKREKC